MRQNLCVKFMRQTHKFLTHKFPPSACLTMADMCHLFPRARRVSLLAFTTLRHRIYLRPQCYGARPSLSRMLGKLDAIEKPSGLM